MSIIIITDIFRLPFDSACVSSITTCVHWQQATAAVDEHQPQRQRMRTMTCQSVRQSVGGRMAGVRLFRLYNMHTTQHIAV